LAAHSLSLSLFTHLPVLDDAVVGFAVGPLGVADDSGASVCQTYLKSGEHDDERQRQQDAHQPYAHCDAKGRSFAHARPQRIHDRHVPKPQTHRPKKLDTKIMKNRDEKCRDKLNCCSLK